MNKKVIFTLACAAVLALGFVCQKQSSLNALVDNNIEALTSGEGGTYFTLETLPALTTGYTTIWIDPKDPKYGYELVWEETREGWRKGVKIESASGIGGWIHNFLYEMGMAGDPNKYLCIWNEGNKEDGYCYEIVVNSSH